ncbi:Hypothetical protein (Fragment) [Durusdinium trenchii]|uniref:Uncharacterized protein n=1 Tax=Durusdinium trenchii TaxID=1381693 RepID=A0ABP0ND50_9DINO
MLQALLELQQLVDSSRSGPHGHGVSAMMQWLGRTREELCLWGQRAGRALRALAGSNEKLQEPKEFGNQLHSLLEGSFMEALKHTSSRFDEELSQLREELQQTRSEATAAATEAQKQEAIAAAKEAAQWRASSEQLLHKKFEDSQAADELHWHNLREEIIRSKDYVFSELAEQHKHSVKNLSELWSSQNLQRERELHLLREQAENALMEMKSSIGSAQLASSKAESEQRALSASEQREKGALSLLLAEAMDAVSTRDRSVDHLRRSLGEEHARPEPVQAAMTLSQCQTPSILGSAGPIPPSPKPSAMDTANIGSPGKYAERTIRVMQAGSYEDSSASVCRLSTESTPYGAKHLPEALSRRTVMETSQSEKAGLQSQVAQGAGVPPRPAVDTQSCMSGQRPFRIDKVPQSVSLRRQSQASATSKRRTRVEAGHRGASTTDRDAKPGLSPSASTDTLRITASWD